MGSACCAHCHGGRARIDNLISLPSSPIEWRKTSARRRDGSGLRALLLLRLALLATVAIIVKLTTPVFSIMGRDSPGVTLS